MSIDDLDHDACYRAVQQRDVRFDGRFFTGVRSTGIYCRPICTARTPLSKNVSFHRTAAAAAEAGFRPACAVVPRPRPTSVRGVAPPTPSRGRSA